MSAGLGQRGDAQDGLARSDYIGSEKRILHRCLAERGVVLTAEAHARLDALPERFADFLVVAHDHAGLDHDGLDHQVAA